MRRLLAATALAAAALGAAPATAATCTPGNPRVCVTVIECLGRICGYIHPIVDPQCDQDHHQILPCDVVDPIYVDVNEIIRTAA